MRRRKKKLLFHLFLHIGKLLEDRIRERFGPEGLHVGQGRVIDALSRHEELSQADLARGLHIKPPTVTSMITRMEENGLIMRDTDDEDARVLRVRLTAKGKEAAAFVRETWERIEDEILAALPSGSDREWQVMLRTLRDNLGGKGPEV